MGKLTGYNIFKHLLRNDIRKAVDSLNLSPDEVKSAYIEVQQTIDDVIGEVPID